MLTYDRTKEPWYIDSNAARVEFQDVDEYGLMVFIKISDGDIIPKIAEQSHVDEHAAFWLAHGAG